MSVDNGISHGDEHQVSGPSGSDSQEHHQESTPTMRHPHHVHLSPVLELRRLRTHDDDGTRQEEPQLALRRTRSHVSVDYFDPRGVRQLSRALSRVSNIEQSRIPSSSLEDSEETLSPGEQFDFEKTVRIWLQKWVLYYFSAFVC